MSSAIGQAQQLQNAQRLRRAGQPAAALEIFQKLAKAAPPGASLLAQIGSTHLDLGRPDEAVDFLRRAIAIKPAPEFFHDLASAYRRQGRLADALAAIDKGLALRPDDSYLLTARAEYRSVSGAHADALEQLEAAVAGRDPDAPTRLTLSRLCQRLKRHQEGLARLGDIPDDPALEPGLRIEALFLLGDLLDGLARYDEAFDAYRRAHAVTPRPFNADAYRTLTDAEIAAWTRPVFDAIPRPKTRSDLPVFILGMPRSGTTLVEQILASHPKAAAGGELPWIHAIAGRLQGVPTATHVLNPASLTARDTEKAAYEYISKARKLAGNAARLTDKQPTNFQHAALIAAAILPDARIIHCTRHPLDTCLSCYFQNFAGGRAIASDLAGLAHYHNQYARMIAHWKSLGVEMLDVPYESLVADFEPWARAIVAHARLDWDPACLAFHQSSRVAFTASNEQVRRPVYRSSVARWRAYAAHLAEPRRVLAQAGNLPEDPA